MALLLLAFGGRDRRGRRDAIAASASIPPPRIPVTGLSLFDPNGTLMWRAPFSPKTVNHGNLAPSFADGERDGRPPLLLRASDPRPTLECELLLAHPDINTSVENWINTLRYIAKRPHPIRVQYGPSESLGLWRMTELSFSSVERNEFAQITRATVSMRFTTAVDATTNRGPLSGGTKPATGTAPAPTGAVAAATRTYTVKRGDTLSGISVSFYRTAARWPEIAKANGISDPKRLQIGQVLKIP